MMWGVMPLTIQAESISYQTSFGPEVVPAPDQNVGELPLFSSTLGELDRVEIAMTLTSSLTEPGGVTWDNESPIVTHVSLGIGAVINGQTSAGNLVSLIATDMTYGTREAVAADDDGLPDFIGDDSFTINLAAYADARYQSSTEQPMLNEFTGDGTFDVILSSVMTVSISTMGGWGQTQTIPGELYGTLEVTYHYTRQPFRDPEQPTPIPTPATIAAGLTLLSLGLSRRIIRYMRTRQQSLYD